MSFPAPVRRYLVAALELPTIVFEENLSKFDADHAIWDFQPDPNRFSLKAVIAHLADWNDIFQKRIQRTRDEEFPTLPDMDEGQIAVDREYATCDPVETLDRFGESRLWLIDEIRNLRPEDWDRKALRANLGELTIGEHVALIGAHDAYHLRQVFDYRRLFEKSS